MTTACRPESFSSSLRFFGTASPPPAERADRGVFACRGQIADPVLREAKVTILRARDAPAEQHLPAKRRASLQDSSGLWRCS